MNYKSINLFPQTVYIMYLVAENGMGQSDIFLHRFKTARYPYGAMLSLGLND